MSIAVLTQVFDEARRLAMAGSAVAHGDFRLKKLLPALDQAGAKAPVFAKVAESARAVIDGPDESSAESLLELTSLVTAVLYTQGETGIAGALEPIETTELGGTTTQAGAHVLKPLLEALSSTGSGRLGLVRDAHERGAFRDLRLVRPALDGLDDPYPEIADFLAENVLPLYGPAIQPGLRAKYDPKGGKGDARRLTLVHAIDPAGSRELVREALDVGSKEVRVAAVGCLGGSPDDLSFLVEQVSAKAKEVRAAAYRSLAAMDDPVAADALKAAIAGKDVDLAAAAIARSKSNNLPDLLIAEITKARTALPKIKDKQEVSEAAERLCVLIAALPDREHAAADALTLDLFADRGELANVKGAAKSGSDVAEAVIRRMAEGPRPLQLALARAHAELNADELVSGFRAARSALPTAEVYDSFAPYLTAKIDMKKRGKDSAWAKRETILDTFCGQYAYLWHRPDTGLPPLDPRWFDLAVRIKHLGLVRAVGRPGHAAAWAFLQAEFDAATKNAKDQNRVNEVLAVMVHQEHPNATEALVACFEKAIKAKANSYPYSYLIPELPKSAIPRLEAVVPKLKDQEADRWLAAIEQLRSKD
jgi:hypothetical protein